MQLPKLLTPRFGQQQPQHQKITTDKQGNLVVPNHVTIPVIHGDGIGPDVVPQSQRVVDKAIQLAYGLTRSINWLPLVVGQKAMDSGKEPIPQDVVKTLDEHRVFYKGPLDTPIGGGLRSVNVQLRKIFDLFACIRPVVQLPNVPTPLKDPKTDLVIFRENTEDVYSGIEFEKDSPEAKKLINYLKRAFKVDIRPDSAIGIKPISEFGSKRLIRSALQYAIDHNRPSVTLVAKGNIMKFTEGKFLDYGYEVAKQEFPGKFVDWDELEKQYGGDLKKANADGKILIQEKITDAMLQDVIQSIDRHSVIATMNLTGDLLSDAVAATAGGLGIAPSGNIGEGRAMFEAAHGSAPKYAGQNSANPIATFLSMKMMLDFMGWKEAATKLQDGILNTLKAGIMTTDLTRKIGTKGVSTSAFTDAVIKSMEQDAGGQKKTPAA